MLELLILVIILLWLIPYTAVPFSGLLQLLALVLFILVIAEILRAIVRK